MKTHDYIDDAHFKNKIITKQIHRKILVLKYTSINYYPQTYVLTL